MGLLNDVSNTIKELREVAASDEVRSIIGSKKNSLSRKGTEGTLQFPNICSRALSIDHAIMINKALERQYAVFTQITLSLNPYLDLSKDKDVSSYLKRLHQNHKKGFLNTLGDLSLENNMSIMCDDDENIEAKFIISEGTSVVALKDQMDNLYHTMDYINESCLNELYTPKTPLVNFKNPNLNTFFNNRICLEAPTFVTEADYDFDGDYDDELDFDELNYNINKQKARDAHAHNVNTERETERHNRESEAQSRRSHASTVASNILNRKLKTDQFKHQQKQDKINNKLNADKFDEQIRHNKESEAQSRRSHASTVANNILNRKLKTDQFKHQQKQDEINNKLNADKFAEQIRKNKADAEQKEKEFLYKQQRDLEQDRMRQREFNISNMGNTSVRMSDSECKKANELVPTTLAVSLNVKEHGNFGGTVNFVIGIKTILHPVTSDEMIRNLVLGCKNSSKFFKFLKWTTGEIKFFKDFLLNVTDIRTDVLNTMSNKESGWWTALKRRRQISDLKRRFGQGLMPNAAITLSMDEVQLIRSNYGYDLTDPKLVTKIMSDYFLLSFIIVDPSQELAMFLFDGETHFQTMSFAGLERENNNNKNDFKEIYKLINSGRL